MLTGLPLKTRLTLCEIISIPHQLNQRLDVGLTKSPKPAFPHPSERRILSPHALAAAQRTSVAPSGSSHIGSVPSHGYHQRFGMSLPARHLCDSR